MTKLSTTLLFLLVVNRTQSLVRSNSQECNCVSRICYCVMSFHDEPCIQIIFSCRDDVQRVGIHPSIIKTTRVDYVACLYPFSAYEWRLIGLFMVNMFCTLQSPYKNRRNIFCVNNLPFPSFMKRFGELFICKFGSVYFHEQQTINDIKMTESFIIFKKKLKQFVFDRI